jgi:hypothetical protein
VRTFLAAVAVFGLLISPSQLSAAGTPQNVARVGYTSGTIRETFISTPNGGIEDTVVTKPNLAAVASLRARMRRRVAAFVRGTFVDPTDPHGDLVPGLREMRRQWSRMHVHYQNLPTGSRIRYTTNDPVMVEALHQWFAARAAKKL